MDDTNVDEIEICQNVEPHRDGDLIKSKAVVKFSAVQVPAQFTRLQCNTDLNMPPSNWLSSSASSNGLQQFIYHSTGFASFRMAHKFPDCLGEVDVVSDAENIKNLLKLPYSPKNAISMMVHRIGNTLLIDEFDIQKYLLRQADDDWKWLRTFIVENILSSLNEKDRSFCIKDKSRGAVQRKNLLSKFLYHSLLHADTEIPDTEPIVYTDRRPLRLTGPILPEPNNDENVPDPHSNHVFNRNVVWTFEDIRMLIGTDMPIFGGGTRPCISLRLRDMAKPISVLTGIDYWLDNLMCNVPEVVMCYHLDGIVQKYELIKTEDLPYLEDSHFSPKVVRNVAQNILAFLKANATKAGHTYWLFKGRNDDVVKLYDLTTLCRNEDCDEKSENPFTVPVAMLLYTVARNMRNSTSKMSSRKAGSIKTLLDNCIKLLPKEKYPQIVTSSHYILSDLHIPAGINPQTPNFDSGDIDSDTQSIYDDDFGVPEYDMPEDEDDDEEYITGDIATNFAMKNICETLKDFNLNDNWKNNKLPSPLVAPVEERCKIALQHIHSGLDCLKYFASNEEKVSKEKEEMAKEQEKQKIIHEEQHPNMAKPFQPIPLPYESLKPEPKMANPDVAIPLDWEKNAVPSTSRRKPKNKKAKQKEKVEFKPLVQNTKVFDSWNIHLKLLLVEKACLTYATLAEYSYNIQQYGSSVRYIYMALRCQNVVTSYMSTAASQRSCLLGRAGDLFFQMSKNWNEMTAYIADFHKHNDLDDLILLELEKDLGKDENKEFIEPMLNYEHMMTHSCNFYETALNWCADDATEELVRRLGSVRNELGLKYMSWAQEEYNKFMTEDGEKQQSVELNEPLYQTLARKSFDSLIRGVAAFEQVKDEINLAFLLSNMGRFNRFRAHIHMNGEQPNTLSLQRKYYKEAFSYYNRALSTLGTRNFDPVLWDIVHWELSTAIFTLAKLIQDGEPKVNIVCRQVDAYLLTTSRGMEYQSTEEIEHEILDLLQKSLKFSEVESYVAHYDEYRIRSGLIHQRLGSFYHCVHRVTNDDTRRRTSLQLAKKHYEKASNILEGCNEFSDFLIVQFEHVKLFEFVAEGVALIPKVKVLHKALEIFLRSRAVVAYLSNSDNNSDEVFRNVKSLKERLQTLLRTLTKLCSPNGSRETGKLSAQFKLYKTMYTVTLSTTEYAVAKEFYTNFSKELVKLYELDKAKKL